MEKRWLVVGLLVWLVGGCAQASKELGGPVNVAAFADVYLTRSGDEKLVYLGKRGGKVEKGGAIEVEWREPRDVLTVIVRGPRLPRPDALRVEWWYRIWPDNGSGGWQKLDDPFNGKWIAAQAIARVEDGAVRFDMTPLTRAENPQIKQEGAKYRRTFKVRIIFAEETGIDDIEVQTGAVWKSAELCMEWKPRSGGSDWPGKIEARNATIISQQREGGRVRVRINYADSPDRLSADRGYVIFRNPGWESFSVFVDDVVREGGMYVRDIDAFVSDASRPVRFTAWQRPQDAWDATIMEKVAALPEQSYEAVQKAIPAKPPREAHLGVPNMRQEFTILANGDIAIIRDVMHGKGRDLDWLPWKDKRLEYRISTGEPGSKRQVRRYLEEGFLPVIHAEWGDGTIAWHQASLATLLEAPLGQDESVLRGDEPLVLLNRIDLENTGSATQKAQLHMAISPDSPLRIDNGLLAMEKASDDVDRPGMTITRGFFNTNGRGALSRDEKTGVLTYSLELPAGQKHSVFFNLAYVELLSDVEYEALKALRFDRQHDQVVAYWRQRIESGMRIEVPEPVLNNFVKANVWHTLITTDRDPATGLDQHYAATEHYLNYANETCMVAESLEMRGMHGEAERLLRTFLECQSAKGLPGKFTDEDGVLYAAYPDPANDPYTAQGYNMDHGWVLWKAAEHYQWTRDRMYLKEVAPRLVAACDWIIRQRNTTKVKNRDGSRPVEWGLAPAGDLEDVEEYLYWYATNAYYYVGVKTAADVLAEVGHDQAKRLAKEAEAYRADILDSLREAVANSPVVKLRDGTWVPYVPSRAYVHTHLKEGWIREALYPALHLVDAQLLEPDHPLVGWMLQDLEDNIFLSRESGYGVENASANFFHFGGFTLQPNLLPNATAHLRRDEIPNFLRVFYNTFHASFYPDMVCFAEWVKYYGSGNGPLYKTPDECKFIQLVRNMLVHEEGRELVLGSGVPRAWMSDGKSIRIENAATFFGPMNLRITSHAAEGKIEAAIDLPRRNRPEMVKLRLRHPDGRAIRKVSVNGKEWNDVDSRRDMISLPPTLERADVVAWY